MQDSLSESSGRVVCEEEGRRLAASLSPRCVYYETCAPYGLNVERVFKECEWLEREKERDRERERERGVCPEPLVECSSFFN